MARTTRDRSPASPHGQASSPRDLRVIAYAALDYIMAGLYAVVFFGLIPNRHGWVQVLAALLVAAPAAMGFAMLLRRRWSWWVGVVGCTALLVLALVFFTLTLISAAFLAGVYGSFGRAGAALALLGAALIVQLIVLLPAFQLKFLMTRAGRRLFALAPLGSAQ